MDILRVCLAGVILAIFLSFKFRTELSRFEINRLAENSNKYKILARFCEIYPGILILSRIIALIAAILLTIFATISWGIWGGLAIALAAILLAFLVSRLLYDVSDFLIKKHLTFFNKYFSWSKILGRINVMGDSITIHSEQELAHIINNIDIIDDKTKNLVKNALGFNKQCVTKAMTPRDKIAFIKHKEELTPKFIDELYNSGHKVFPVVQGNLNKIVGILYLDDILPVGQEEKDLLTAMRKSPSAVEHSDPLETALRQMSDSNCNVLLVTKNEKTIGILTLADIVRTLFS